MRSSNTVLLSKNKKYFVYLIFMLMSVQFIQAQEMFNGVMYEPLPLPQVAPGDLITNESSSNSKMVFYDLKKKQVSTLGQSTSENITLSQENFVKGNVGEVPSNSNASEQLNSEVFTDLVRVQNPEESPWRVNVKLFISTKAGNNYVCSGVLIDACHVLTAAHCVYFKDEGGWVNSITVVPAYENGARPYGDANATFLRSWTGWTVDEKWEWDMALITIDRPVGGLTGWHGYGFNTDGSFFRNNTFHNPGYPSERPFNGQFMYYWYGRFDQTPNEHLVYHNNFMYRGQSGSGSYKITDGSRFVYSVASHRTSTRAGHVRMNRTKFDNIQGWIKSDLNTQLDLYAFNTQSGPSTIQAGQRLSKFEFYLHNNSSKDFQGGFTARVYLSSNNFISTNDRPIATLNYSGLNIPSRNTWRLFTNNPPVIPTDISPGKYYLGVIVDYNDSNRGNNTTQRQDTYELNVTPALTVTPTSILANYLASRRSISVSGNVPWTVSETSSWLSVSPTSGDKNGSFAINLDRNNNVNERSATITVRGGGITRRVFVRQSGAPPALSVSPDSRSVGYEAGVTSFSISSNTTWQVVETSSWLSVSPTIGSGNRTLRANYSENPSFTSRTAQIRVSIAGVQRTVIVRQAGKPLLISGISLVDAEQDLVLKPLNKVDTVCLDTLKSDSLSILVSTSPSQIGSVLFNLLGPDGLSLNTVDNTNPYTLFGDQSGDFKGRKFSPGLYTLIVRPYADANADGIGGSPDTIQFYLKKREAYSVVGLELYDAKNDVYLTDLKDGQIIDLDLLSTHSLAIEATTTDDAESVSFELNGPISVSRSESIPPYTSFGDRRGDYNGKFFCAGKYTLTTTAYSADGAKGAQGTPLSITFEVVGKPALDRVVLVDANYGSDILEMDGQPYLDLNKIGDQLNIRVDASCAESISFTLLDQDGKVVEQRVESNEPYALFGDRGGRNYNAWTPTIQTYTLLVQAHSLNRARGDASEVKKITFEVDNTDISSNPAVSPISLILHPNPVKSGETMQITFSEELKGDFRILVKDNMGNLIQEGQISKASLSQELASGLQVGNLKPGLYTIQVWVAEQGKMLTAKFVKH